MKTKIKLTILFFFCVANILSQPTDNPYRTRFNPEGQHWTDSLVWTNVHSIHEYAGNTWEEKLNNAQNALTSQGGVIYFPAGIYTFESNLLIKTKLF